MYSRVLLPDPEGPTMKAQAPVRIRKLTPRRASTCSSPLGYVLHTSWASIMNDSSRGAGFGWPGGSTAISLGPLPDGIHRLEAGGPPSRVEAAETPHDERQAEAQPEEAGGDGQTQATAEELVGHQGRGEGHGAAKHPGEQAQVGALERHQGEDLPPGPAVGAHDAELKEPLGCAHQHRVDDPHAPDHQGEADDQEEEHVE